MGIIVFGDNILNKMVFRFRYPAVGSLPYQHDKVLQEANLLDVQLLSLDGKGIHCDRIFLGVADVLTVDIIAKSLVGITCIYQYDIGILLPKLAHHTVGEEGLTTTRRAKNKEVAVVCNLVLTFLSADVDSNWHSLPVCIIDFKRSVLTMLDMLLVHKASSSIA